MNIESSYDIDIRNIVEISDSHMNKIFIADSKYVVKIYNKEVCRKDIENELHLYDVMQNMTMLKIPKLIKDKWW